MLGFLGALVALRGEVVKNIAWEEAAAQNEEVKGAAYEIPKWKIYVITLVALTSALVAVFVLLD